MRASITYGQLDRMLTELGFEARKLPSGHVVYESIQHDTLVAFPILGSNQPVRPTHLLTTRKMILERGIIDEETLDRLMYEQDKVSVRAGEQSVEADSKQ